jgi:hypothetical protein
MSIVSLGCGEYRMVCCVDDVCLTDVAEAQQLRDTSHATMRLDLEHPGVAERWRTISGRLMMMNIDHGAGMSREEPDSPVWK